ncbi:hypothetical protein [Costertonia aggregata]|uniref:Uncharacterized protein n=1 Tax=Costertonia aggregata TaxID=343403 RepID=A0A7H9AUM4_9FLAO|nr:hypothetical protein [Costertonia aggregata]QLG46895.1 hypothetical protein HYG79_16555 [Costertonia aggregata]
METIIEKYNNLQKEILSDFSLKWDGENCETTFRNDVKDFYGFEKKFGWNILLNAFYVIDDTELAKKSFKEFDLQGPSRHRDIGERYLRLYGLLNATYQQKLAVENLLEIHKVEKKKEHIKKLTDSELIIIRNKIGAHSANFLSTRDDSEHKFDVYEISRPELERGKIRLLRNQNDFENYDLEKAINEFNELVEEILSIVIAKVISKIFNNQGKYFKEYQIINKIRNGAILIGDKLIEFTTK